MDNFHNKSHVQRASIRPPFLGNTSYCLQFYSRKVPWLDIQFRFKHPPILLAWKVLAVKYNGENQWKSWQKPWLRKSWLLDWHKFSEKRPLLAIKMHCKSV